MFSEWWYRSANTTTWNDMTLNERLLHIGIFIAVLIVAYIAGRLLDKSEYKDKRKW